MLGCLLRSALQRDPASSHGKGMGGCRIHPGARSLHTGRAGAVPHQADQLTGLSGHDYLPRMSFPLSSLFK